MGATQLSSGERAMSFLLYHTGRFSAGRWMRENQVWNIPCMHSSGVASAFLNESTGSLGGSFGSGSFNNSAASTRSYIVS